MIAVSAFATVAAIGLPIWAAYADRQETCSLSEEEYRESVSTTVVRKPVGIIKGMIIFDDGTEVVRPQSEIDHLASEWQEGCAKISPSSSGPKTPSF